MTPAMTTTSRLTHVGGSVRWTVTITRVPSTSVIRTLEPVRRGPASVGGLGPPLLAVDADEAEAVAARWPRAPCRPCRSAGGSRCRRPAPSRSSRRASGRRATNAATRDADEGGPLRRRAATSAKASTAATTAPIANGSQEERPRCRHLADAEERPRRPARSSARSPARPWVGCRLPTDGRRTSVWVGRSVGILAGSAPDPLCLLSVHAHPDDESSKGARHRGQVPRRGRSHRAGLLHRRRGGRHPQPGHGPPGGQGRHRRRPPGRAGPSGGHHRVRRGGDARLPRQSGCPTARPTPTR